MTVQKKRDKVIKGLECCLEIRNICWDNPKCPYNDCEDRACGDGCMSFMMRDALELLKAQEPRAMTLEEVVALQEGNGDVWIEETAMPGAASRIIAATLAQKKNWQELGALWFSDDQCRCVNDYNINTAYGWRCWTSRPTDEQRKAVEWDG